MTKENDNTTWTNNVKFKIPKKLYHLIMFYLITYIVMSFIFYSFSRSDYGDSIFSFIIWLNLVGFLIFSLPVIVMYLFYRDNKESFSKRYPKWITPYDIGEK